MTDLFTKSSVIYNKYKEGIPIFNKIKEGIKIQIDSKFWFSNRFILVILLKIIIHIMNLTTLIINTRIMLIKSWKKINSNIIYELASCRLNKFHEAI